jgi:hypothetical protein
VAAIATVMFAVLGQTPSVSEIGSAGTTGSASASIPSAWKLKGRSESLR